MEIGTGVSAKPDMSSEGSDGAENVSVSGNLTRGPCRSLVLDGTPDATGRVPKIHSMASLNALTCCCIANGQGNAGCIEIKFGIVYSIGDQSEIE